jgi:hypothetical protein
MRSVLLLPLLLLSFFAQGQSYRCIIPGEKAYFANTDHYLRGIRIDSTVTVGTATVYYPFRSLRGNPEMGSSPLSLGGAWVGDKITEYPDGTYLVINTWNDTVVIKTLANIGDVWNFYTDTSAIYYRAEVISKSLELVDGITDSVKTIEIRAFHRDTGYVPSDPSNGLRIGISKSHGFYELFDLFMFPHRLVRNPGIIIVTTIDTIDAWFRYANQQQFQRTQFRTPTKMEMYDFEVGDIFEYAGDCNSFSYYSCYQVMMDTCIAKEPLSSTSVKYTFSRHRYQHMSGYGYPFPPTTVSHSTYTIIADTSAFQIVPPGKMPEETYIDSILYYHANDSVCVISDVVSYSTGYLFNFFEPCGSQQTYKVGYGEITEKFCDNPGGGGFMDKMWKQVYSKRHGITCGTFTPVPNQIHELETTPILRVSPNPACSNLSITLANADYLVVQLMDISGRNIKSLSGVPPFSVDVSDTPPGTYFIIANDADGRTFHGIVTVFH